MKHIGAIIMKKFSYVTFITYYLHFSTVFMISINYERIMNIQLTISKFTQRRDVFYYFFVNFHKRISTIQLFKQPLDCIDQFCKEITNLS